MESESSFTSALCNIHTWSSQFIFSLYKINSAKYPLVHRYFHKTMLPTPKKFSKFLPASNMVHFCLTKCYSVVRYATVLFISSLTPSKQKKEWNTAEVRKTKINMKTLFIYFTPTQNRNKLRLFWLLTAWSNSRLGSLLSFHHFH